MALRSNDVCHDGEVGGSTFSAKTFMNDGVNDTGAPRPKLAVEDAYVLGDEIYM